MEMSLVTMKEICAVWDPSQRQRLFPSLHVYLRLSALKQDHHRHVPKATVPPGFAADKCCQHMAVK